MKAPSMPSQRVPDSPIIMDHDVFKSLNESSLDVTSFSRLGSRINQSFTTGHSVEEELLRSQST